MRNPVNWNVYAQGSQPAMLHGERGYTGHEQLNQFGLINMNARLYDPLLGRFLAPDPQVSEPETSNGYNRYMYASDNPMMFVDLNGEDSGYPDDGLTGGSWNGSGGSGSGQSSMGYNQNTGSSNSSSGLYIPGRGNTGGAYQDFNSGFGGYSGYNSNGLGSIIMTFFEWLFNSSSGSGSGSKMKLSGDPTTHAYIKTAPAAAPSGVGAPRVSSGGRNLRMSVISAASQRAELEDLVDAMKYKDFMQQQGAWVETEDRGEIIRGNLQLATSVLLFNVSNFSSPINWIKSWFNGTEGIGTETSTNSILTESQTLRIQNAATRINRPINVVGSRASGTAKLTSDWDYVIQGMTNKEWKMIKNSLPGAPSRIDGLPRMIDVFNGSLDLTKPYITIYPR